MTHESNLNHGGKNYQVVTSVESTKILDSNNGLIVELSGIVKNESAVLYLDAYLRGDEKSKVQKYP